jgi:hypothetical protein
MEECTDTYDTFCSTPSLKFPTESEHTKDNTQWKRRPAIWLERLVAGILTRKKFSVPGIGFLHSNSTFSCQYYSIIAPHLFIHTIITDATWCIAYS